MVTVAQSSAAGSESILSVVESVLMTIYIKYMHAVGLLVKYIDFRVLRNQYGWLFSQHTLARSQVTSVISSKGIIGDRPIGLVTASAYGTVSVGISPPCMPLMRRSKISR